jgi:hypothetical protein
MSFSADPDNGMYRATSNVLSFSAGGVGQAHIQSNTLWFGRAIVISGANPTNFDVIPGYSNSTDIAGTNLRISGGPSTGSAAGGALIFQTSPAGSTGSTANSSVERMRITSGNDVYFGNGTTNASPANPTIRATGGTGSNVAGGELNLYGGQSTGSGAGGPIRFFTSAAGSSGSSPNSNTERVRVTSDGDLLFAGTTQVIASNTSDGSDSKELWLSGGGTPGGFARGAHLRLQGNENVNNGSAVLQSGDNSSSTVTISGRGSSSSVIFQTNGGTERMRITSGGTVYFGNGDFSASPAAATLRGTNGQGTDIAGAELIVQAGAGTGNAASGAVTFRTATAGASGSGTNSSSDRMRVKTNGQVRFMPLAADPAGAEDGDVYYNSATNKLRVRAGGAWVDLH